MKREHRHAGPNSMHVGNQLERHRLPVENGESQIDGASFVN